MPSETNRAAGPAFPLLLASTSPRRHYLLREAGIPFDVVAPKDVAEDFPPGEPPAELVVRHALTKARSVAADHPRRLILGADTVVVLNKKIHGKPADEAEARAILSQLQGQTHTVHTGLALVAGSSGRELAEAEATEVKMRPLSAEDISSYVATGEPLDKAGAYAVQGRGSLLIERVVGDYFNVVGLPLYRLSKMLEGFGLEVLR